MRDHDNLGLDLSKVPIVGGLLTTIAQTLSGQVRAQVVDRIAAFHKLEPEIRQMQMTMASLSVGGGTIQQQAKVAAARAFVDETWIRWNVTAKDIDSTLTKLNTGALDKQAVAQAVARIAANVTAITQMVSRAKAMVRALGGGESAFPVAAGGGMVAMYGLFVIGAIYLARRTRGR